MSQVKVKKTFLDAIRIYVKAGNGGNGLPKYGSVGGKGGDIYVKGVKGKKLIETKALGTSLKASKGQDCSRFRIFGKPGADLIIPVPLGTVVKTENYQNLGEIVKEDDQVLVAKGGAGGSKHNQYVGQKGQNHHIHLLLKLIADIGLVGFPNAGKSTLLRAISKAKPKVASYPFTTLEPMVANIVYKDLREITMADLPGLIEGAWMNAGKGHSFLRHVERTKLLMFIVDVEGFQLGPEYPFRTPIENIILLNKELELYNAELIDKPSVLIVNKMDKENSDKNFERLKQQLTNIKEISKSLPEEYQPDHFVEFYDVVPCSAKYDPKSVNNVKNFIRKAIDTFSFRWDEQFFEGIKEKIKDNLHEKQNKYV